MGETGWERRRNKWGKDDDEMTGQGMTTTKEASQIKKGPGDVVDVSWAKSEFFSFFSHDFF